MVSQFKERLKKKKFSWKKLAPNNNTTLQFFLYFLVLYWQSNTKTLSWFFYLKTFNSNTFYNISPTYNWETYGKKKKKLIKFEILKHTKFSKFSFASNDFLDNQIGKEKKPGWRKLV